MTRYCDAHIHLSHSMEPVFAESEQYFCVTSCHSKEEFESLGRYLPSGRSDYPHFRYSLHSSASLRNASGGATIPTAKEQLIDGTPRQNHRFCRDSLKTCLAGFAPSGRSLPTAEVTSMVFASYGIHPQSPALRDKTFIEKELSFIENLLAEKKIIAIGECGFDFFTPEFKSTAPEQEIVFNEQLFLAQKYNVPIVLHLRKSIEKIFTYSRELKKLPAVIFHSFPGTLREAQSLQNHGINAFFSFGKPILNGKKASIDCVQNLPIQNILFETDATYQTLKDEKETLPSDIKKVYQRACELRGLSIEDLCEKIFINFKSALNL